MALALSFVALALSSAALAIVGVAVLALRPRHGPARVLASHCIGWGLSYGAYAFVGDATYGALFPGWTQPVFLAGTAIAIVGTLGLVLAVPRWLGLASGRRVLIGGTLAGTAMAIVVWSFGSVILAGFPWYLLLATTLGNAALAFTTVALPLRFAATSSEDAPTRRTIALLAAALALFVAPEGGDLALAARTGGLLVRLDVLFTACLLSAAPLWLWAGARHDARTTRRIALLIPAALLAAMILPEGGREVSYALGTLASALLLAYAVMRGQIEGLDLKVRFALSRSTVAGAFVAVFFLASEGTQMLVGRSNPVVGLVAAGALVFAMSPLQRAADRFAERAVPIPAGPAMTPASADRSRELRVYERAVRAAAGDGPITRDEEQHLAHIAHELGIPHPEALRVRHEIEDAQGAPR